MVEPGRAPHGARELKLLGRQAVGGLLGRAPHGARELKPDDEVDALATYWSRPPRGA